ncbi:conserved hypothetical protein [Rhodopseudomonas palustris HaA2]|uniref:Uncharacterized protein n=1 Tax=Rhodopseudomonas palustris (strain HaA2) TaxID=316058 RepID=Q2IXG9_RHOP2|nr:hypothetical protein [Rhodopseudomonas palustris]ABD07091.1 conserved hypothetical protein [Rhodopseudomonas palustris HaA2]
MEWASWSAAADRILHSPNLPIWAAMAAAAVFVLILVIALVRADRSVANAVLGVITLLAVGVAGLASWRLFVDSAGPVVRNADAGRAINTMPALACVDDLAGDAVQAACERALFSSPETVAAAVSYASARMAQLTAQGDVASASKRMTPELDRLRRSIERDRYGLIAYVLTAQDRCVPDQCAAFQSLTDHSRIAANMNEHVYETTVTRAAPAWGAGSGPLAAAAPVPGGVLGVAEAPSGKPVNIDFATSSSIPPISIMNEPAPAAPKPAATAAGNAAGHAAPSAAAKRPPAAPSAQAPANGQAAAAGGQAPANAQAAVRRPPPPPKPKPPVAAPVQLAPAEANPDN